MRLADPADIDDLARLRGLWGCTELTPEFETVFRRWFQQEQSSRRWWVARDGADRACGMVNIKVFERMPSPTDGPSRWGYLANLFVEPAVRGAGVGAALVQAAVDRAGDEGLVRLVLSPSELSAPLYRRLGFRAADELMVLTLAQ